jgi:hypothetical protein
VTEAGMRSAGLAPSDILLYIICVGAIVLALLRLAGLQ